MELPDEGFGRVLGSSADPEQSFVESPCHRQAVLRIVLRLAADETTSEVAIVGCQPRDGAVSEGGFVGEEQCDLKSLRGYAQDGFELDFRYRSFDRARCTGFRKGKGRFERRASGAERRAGVGRAVAFDGGRLAFELGGDSSNVGRGDVGWIEMPGMLIDGTTDPRADVERAEALRRSLRASARI